MVMTSPPPRWLENGDRLGRREFHRRYAADPRDRKAELVEGVVYVASPLRAREHGTPPAALMAWAGTYAAEHPEVQIADATAFLDSDDEVQPDLLLRRVDGSSRITDDGYIDGPPEFVAEVAASSVSIDLHDKRNAYRRNGVREYLVWRVEDNAIDWWRLHEGQYVEMPVDAGFIESGEFPGLRLAVGALLAGEMKTVLDAVRTS